MFNDWLRDDKIPQLCQYGVVDVAAACCGQLDLDLEYEWNKFPNFDPAFRTDDGDIRRDTRFVNL